MNDIYTASVKDGLRPDVQLTVSEWADKHRILSQKASSEAGPWRTSRTPYLKEVMDCLSVTSPVQRVVFMAGAQVGKTETGNNWFGYIVHHAPAPMMFVQPTTELAKRLSKQRIAPMIEETPALRNLIAESRSKDSGNTLLSKEFRGGVVILVGANSAVGLRSMPACYVFLDEIDAYPEDVEGEGDPVNIAEKRTTTFPRRKIYLSSTPTIVDKSRIDREYRESDMRRYYVPCPECGHMDWIQWKNIKWDNDDPNTVRLLCNGCGCLIPEHKKTEMMDPANGAEWRATRESDNEKTVGFHLSSLYSPLGWKSWVDIVAEFLKVKADPSRLKTWVNTVLAEAWEEAYSTKIGAEALQEKAEEYNLLNCPDPVLILTAGVDVQDNRLAVKIKGWGEGEESWLINWTEVYGDPSDLGPSGPWAAVDSILLQEYQHESGAKLKVRAAAVDTGGHYTHEAYMFCRARKARNVFAIKGSSTPARPAIGKPSRQDVNYKGKTIKGGVELWLLGTDTIKSTIYGRLKKDQNEGAGSYHFPISLPDEYFKQLTAEKQITKYVNGFPKRIWQKLSGARNEALDCEVYAYAALQYLYTRVNRNSIWLQARAVLDRLLKVEPEKKSKEEDPLSKKEEPKPPVKRNIKRPSRRRGGWVNNW